MPLALDGTLGVSLIQDGTVSSAAKLANGVVTQDKLATAVVPVGVGQTWQSVTGSRMAATPYTNTTGRTITVNITAGAAGTSTVGGVTVGFLSGAANGTSSFPVPNGSTYSHSGAFTNWSELR
jgi:hypothetical protein